MEKITLRVQPAKKRDIGRNIARFDQEIMEELGLKTGDVIALIGKKESAGIVWPGYAQDKGLGMVRIDSRFMKNTDTRINDNIEIQKITAQPVQNIVLAPISVKIKSNPRFETFVKRKLRNYPVTINDFIYISIGISRDITFKVINMRPSGVCQIKPETVLHIRDDPIEDDTLTNMQLKNLRDFLKKLGYTKEELVQLENLYDILKPNYTKDELISFRIRSHFEKLKEEMIDPSEISWRDLFHYLINRFDEISHDKGAGRDWLIGKIALDLHIKFEKTISQGQAEAVLRRVMGITLSSTGRSLLNELRKKIRRYDKFLRHFEEWDSYDFTFKVVIMGLGPEQTTKLIQIPPLKDIRGSRLVLGVEFYPTPIEISDNRVNLQLWNISTEKKFSDLVPNYCLGANGAIIVYNKSNRESFELAKESYKKLKTTTKLHYKSKEKPGIFFDLPVILIGLGNGDNVSAEEGQSLAKEWGAYGYIEMEDTDSQNFENALSSLSLGIINNYQKSLKRYPPAYRFKVIVVGDIKVGKTSLIKQYTQGSFYTDYVKTIGAQFSVYDKEVEGSKVTCIFWDIAGSKEFHFLRPAFFKNSQTAIIVYSLEDDDLGKDSLNQISNWYDEILKYCSDIPIIIIANKADLVDETKLDNSLIQEFVNEKKLLGFFITSVKNEKGVIEAFDTSIEALYNKFKKSV